MLLFLLRLVLTVTLVFYLLKWIGRWISAGAGDDGRPGTGIGKKKDDYSDITDQKVEDADFEEIE